MLIENNGIFIVLASSVYWANLDYYFTYRSLFYLSEQCIICQLEQPQLFTYYIYKLHTYKPVIFSWLIFSLLRFCYYPGSIIRLRTTYLDIDVFLFQLEAVKMRCVQLEGLQVKRATANELSLKLFKLASKSETDTVSLGKWVIFVIWYIMMEIF